MRVTDQRGPDFKLKRILIRLRLDCMTKIVFLDDFFGFLDENDSFSSFSGEIDLKLIPGCEKIPAHF
ncbi:MAG: hypothetical protein V7731_03160 [Amphritea sp.]